MLALIAWIAVASCVAVIGRIAKSDTLTVIGGAAIIMLAAVAEVSA